VFQVRALAKGRTLDTWAGSSTAERASGYRVDVDHTISQTDYDKLLMTQPGPDVAAYPWARDTLAAMAKDYYIVYVTARPHFSVGEDADGWRRITSRLGRWLPPKAERLDAAGQMEITGIGKLRYGCRSCLSESAITIPIRSPTRPMNAAGNHLQQWRGAALCG